MEEPRTESEYLRKAIRCVQDTVLPLQRQQFLECGSLDAQYAKYGDTDAFFGCVIEPHHMYEIGYPACVCPDVRNGLVSDASHCACSRQSILFILQELLPNCRIQVEILHTVLGGAPNCRFRVTVD